MAAQPGNTTAADSKRFAGAVRRALAEFTNDRIKQGEALLAIAQQLVDDAMNQDPNVRAPARREIADRLDGKPAQSVSVGGSDEMPPISAVLIRAIDATANRPTEESQ